MKSPSRSSGMALVIVLSLLVLFATLVIAILVSSRFSREASALYAGSVETAQLADTAVNLCIAQIQDATSMVNRAWVSQPGLIRTFTGNKQADVNYRLYSWTDMRPSGPFNPFAEVNAVPPGWRDRPAVYVDLNQPSPDPTAPGDPARDHYPILYPPGLTGTIPGYGVQTVNQVAAADEVPMPVKWLYVLRDGSVHEATELSGTTVRVAAATNTNPIVGRIAFWADDESSKVNLNTAAGGFPWMPPWVVGRLERPTTQTGTLATENRAWGPIFGFGFGQPMRNEFQRYPGHPATVDLQTVFPELSWRDIYQLVPRVLEGGSENGTIRVRRLLADNTTPINIINDRDRLIAGLGDARFRAFKPIATEPRADLTVQFQDINITGDQWSQMLERRKGLLTVFSRAPEMNLFGQPRVAIWPVPEFDTADQGRPYRTALDQLMAFCSTLTDQSTTPPQRFPFYFDRRTGPFVQSGSVPPNTSLSANADIMRTRNQQIFRYLQRLTDRPFPGVSAEPFSSKYGGDRGRDQILTQIFDYIRSTNMQDKQLDGTRRFNDWAFARPTRWDAGSGEVTGFGRSLAIRQIGFLFICNADPDVPASNRAPLEPPDGSGARENLTLEDFPDGKLTADQRRIQSLLLLELFTPSAGFKTILYMTEWANKTRLNLSVRVRGLGSMTVNGVNLGFPDGATPPLIKLGRGEGGNDIDYASGPFGSFGGAINYRWPYIGRDARSMGRLNSTQSEERSFRYLSLPVTITVDPSNPVMNVSGANLTVEIFSGYVSSDEPETLIASIPVNLDPVTLPVPRLHPDRPEYWAFHRAGVFGDQTPQGRFNNATSGPLRTATSETGSGSAAGRYNNATLIQDRNINPGDTPLDVVQTYILPHGDFRMLFGPSDLTTNRSWIPVPEQTPGPVTVPPALNPPRPNMRHFLTDAEINGGVFGYYTGTSLAPASGRRFTGIHLVPILRQADYPAGVNAPWTFGDWDTGSPWATTDGPLINKPDEGSTYNTTGNQNPYGMPETESETQGTAALFHSANRILPSAVMFGSLPTGLIEGQPWQTLLFRPDPGSHPGAQDPPDHLLLDLFWMPVVEPYAISETFSTAGKVNMNYQIVPFTYIDRSTAVRAVLRGTLIGAIPNNHPRGYRKSNEPGYDPQFSFAIQENETLTTFHDLFNSGGVFLTPSEITTVPLVPEGWTRANLHQFWSQHQVTGENIRERPYATLYPLFTTQSNVFNVHYRVQVLRKSPGSLSDVWNENSDSVITQLVGNHLIERFLDTNRPGGIPDYALPASEDLNTADLYKIRVIAAKEFNP